MTPNLFTNLEQNVSHTNNTVKQRYNQLQLNCMSLGNFNFRESLVCLKVPYNICMEIICKYERSFTELIYGKLRFLSQYTV